MSNKPIHSPAYPSIPLDVSVRHAGKIEGAYRTSSADRKDAAGIIGYTALSGPANKALAALASYGLIERAGKGMIRVSPLAVSILHPQSESEKLAALKEAAMMPPLFRQIREQFPDLQIPPEAGVITHLNRAGFNPNAVPKAAKAFLETARFVEELGPIEVGDGLSDDERKFGGAAVGDLVQWESQGVLQFEKPMRVRWVSDDGSYVAVDGSDAGIPMGQVVINSAVTAVPAETTAPVPPPQSPPPETMQTWHPMLKQENVEELNRGMRKAVFPVSDGDVTFTFPDDLTVDGIEELEAYLAVFLKKEKRMAMQPSQRLPSAD